MGKHKKQFVLIHGVCHGAWTWYKVKPQLEAAGHSVTAVDLAASGISTSRVEEIQSLEDYSKPLLEFLSSLGSDDDEKVILVAHSMGGIPAALAADTFPEKIAAIVFLSSTMPDTTNPPAYVFQKFVLSKPSEELSDNVIRSYGTPDRPAHSFLFGPEFMAKKLYQLSPVQDLELAKLLVRANPSLGTDNLAGTESFTEEGYGSVTRVYIVCGEDQIVPEEYQRLIISNFPPKEVMEIKDADHTLQEIHRFATALSVAIPSQTGICDGFATVTKMSQIVSRKSISVANPAQNLRRDEIIANPSQICDIENSVANMIRRRSVANLRHICDNMFSSQICDSICLSQICRKFATDLR